MKQLFASILIGLFLLTAGFFASTVVSERLTQECVASEQASATYRNTWRDVYFVGQWWPNRDAGKSFVVCAGPSTYLRYHPYDLAGLSLIAAGVLGYLVYRGERAVSSKRAAGN